MNEWSLMSYSTQTAPGTSLKGNKKANTSIEKGKADRKVKVEK